MKRPFAGRKVYRGWRVKLFRLRKLRRQRSITSCWSRC